MKTRNGFVSNSSSSSFILRGARVKKDKLASLLGNNIDDLESGIDLSEFGKDLTIESTRFYFGGEEGDDCLVGLSVRPEDGVVTEVPDDPKRDNVIISGLEKMGLKNPKLSTFFQYVSNDNF